LLGIDLVLTAKLRFFYWITNFESLNLSKYIILFLIFINFAYEVV